MASKKGLENSVEFTKHIMTLSGAGIAFIASIDAASFSILQRFFLGFSLLALGISLGAGLFVWARATTMFSSERYSLNDKYLKYPGLVNVVSFGIGVLALAIFVGLKLYAPPKKNDWQYLPLANVSSRLEIAEFPMPTEAGIT